jgi:hypothetical protein
VAQNLEFKPQNQKKKKKGNSMKYSILKPLSFLKAHATMWVLLDHKFSHQKWGEGCRGFSDFSSDSKYCLFSTLLVGFGLGYRKD